MSQSPRLSFLQPTTAAPFLFSDEEMGLEYIEPDKDGAMKRGEYSAERLFAKRPEVYIEIVRMLADPTISKRQIKRQCKVHHLTISAIQEREGQSIDTLRLSLGKKALNLAAYSLETIEEMLASGRFKPGEMAFLFSALVDKGQLVTGGATSRPDVQGKDNVAAKLEEFLSGLQTHSGAGEKVAVAREVDQAAGVAGTLGDRGMEMVPSDSESLGSHCKTGDVTGFVAAPITNKRGGGGRENDAPPINNDG